MPSRRETRFSTTRSPFGWVSGFPKALESVAAWFDHDAIKGNDKLGRCLSLKLPLCCCSRILSMVVSSSEVYWSTSIVEDPATLRPHRAILPDRGLWRSPGCLCSRPGCPAGRFLNNRIKIGDDETFEPANDLPMMQLFMRADVKSLIHHVTKHARGEFGHADPPVIGSDFLRPGMGRTVAKRDRRWVTKVDLL